MKHLIHRQVRAIFAALGLIAITATCSHRNDVDNYQAAPVAYAILAEKSIDLASSFNVDSWADMLSDSVVYHFPDGDLKTCTKIVGKEALVNWATTHIQSSGIQSMSIEDATYLPIRVSANNSGRVAGTQVIAYLSNKMVYTTGAVSVRMNMIIHFDKDKMIDAYYTYYDNTPIIDLIKSTTTP
jgi:hypothetical protein